MQNVTKKLLAVTMLLSVVHVQAEALDSNPTFGRSYFLPRAQNGTAPDVFGWEPSIHKYDADTFYFDFKTQTEWRQTFDSDKYGQYIFFNGTNTMQFGPANISGAAEDTDVFDLNFLLPVEYVGNVTANPKVQSSITDFSFYFGLDEWAPGLYISLHLPLVYTRWNVKLTEETIDPVTNSTGFTTGQVSATAVTTNPYVNPIQAWAGNANTGVGYAQNWNYGKIDGRKNKTRLGDVALNLAYDFISKENMHLGIGIRGLFGAGGKSKAEYVFEPTIGMAGRLGVGGMLDGHVRLWEKDEDHHICAYLSGYAVHVFDNSQTRSFDFTSAHGGIGTRYDLVKKISAITNTGATFDNILDNMINVGTQKAKISIGATYEVTLQFSYVANKINFDLAYSAGGHSAEKISGDDAFPNPIAANTYILYDTNGADVSTANATNGALSVAIDGNDANATIQAVTTANEAQYCIDNTWLNFDSALAPSVFANTFYANLGYTWVNNDWQPNVSVFANVEFGNNKTLSTWGVGLQGNVSY